MKTQMIKHLLLLMFTLTASYNVLAQTDVSGTIVNGNWTSNNSPYIVVGNINIAGLTIGPGVTVSFATNYSFEVDGVITALGTPNAPIVFKGTNGGWQGIYFNYSSPGSILNCCVVSNSVNSGIRIVNSSPIINGCSIALNSAQVFGGGIYVNNTSGNLTIINTVIANNGANINPALVPYNAAQGGGIYAAMNTNSLEMTGCIVTNNNANANYGYGWGYGGGLYINGNATLKWCVISGNSCEGQTEYNVTGGTAWGGGIFGYGGQISLNNCLINNNTASSPNTGVGDEYAYGGGLYLNSCTVGMTNCIVQANTASAPQAVDGGGICVAGGIYGGSSYYGGVANLSVVNSTIAYNNIEGLAVANGSTANVLNSIVYFNASSGTQVTGVNGTMGTANVTYSDVQNGFVGTGNINRNPIFLSTANLIIVPGSPCINAGNTNSIYNNVYFPPSL